MDLGPAGAHADCAERLAYGVYNGTSVCRWGIPGHEFVSKPLSALLSVTILLPIPGRFFRLLRSCRAMAWPAG